jgi:hypothetical protein
MIYFPQLRSRVPGGAKEGSFERNANNESEIVYRHEVLTEVAAFWEVREKFTSVSKDITVSVFRVEE